MATTSVDTNAGGAGGRSTRGRVPVYSPKLKGEALDVSPQSLSMSMTDSQHDSGSLAVVSTTLENTDGIIDSPISFYYGIPPRTELFQGYVTEVTDEQAAKGQLSFTMGLLGPTKVTFTGKPRFWTAKSATSAISDLANTNGLGVGGHTDSYLWKSLAQTTESDWEMIDDLTSRLGWCLFNRYGVVIIYDPMKEYETAGCYTRLVQDLSDVNSTDRNMIEFNFETVSNMVKDNLGTTFSYFTTANTVQTTTQAGEYSGYVYETDKVVRDQAEAEARMRAATAKIESWGDVAMARVWGDADFFPGMLVQIVTASERYVQPAGDGCWLIRSVGHSADNQQFQTILILTRPTSMNHTQYRAYVPFWQELTPQKSRPSLTLDQDVWVSSWNNRQLRGLL